MTRKEKLAIMSEMGRLGGKRRMQTLTSQRRREIARKAGLARWAKTSPKSTGHFEGELGWLSQHREEYLGQWVALDGARLVASGSSAREVYLAARSAGVTVPFVEQVRPPDELPSEAGKRGSSPRFPTAPPLRSHCSGNPRSGHSARRS